MGARFRVSGSGGANAAFVAFAAFSAAAAPGKDPVTQRARPPAPPAEREGKKRGSLREHESLHRAPRYYARTGRRT